MIVRRPASPLDFNGVVLMEWQNVTFGPLLHGGLVRPDSDAKAFKILSETDVAREQTTVRQANTDRFRRWEVAGTAHLDFRVAQALNPLRLRDIGSLLPTNCVSPFSRIPLSFVFNASVDAMADWMNHGVPMSNVTSRQCRSA